MKRILSVIKNNKKYLFFKIVQNEMLSNKSINNLNTLLLASKDMFLISELRDNNFETNIINNYIDKLNSSTQECGFLVVEDDERHKMILNNILVEMDCLESGVSVEETDDKELINSLNNTIISSEKDYDFKVIKDNKIVFLKKSKTGIKFYKQKFKNHTKKITFFNNFFKSDNVFFDLLDYNSNNAITLNNIPQSTLFIKPEVEFYNSYLHSIMKKGYKAIILNSKQVNLEDRSLKPIKLRDLGLNFIELFKTLSILYSEINADDEIVNIFKIVAKKELSDDDIKKIYDEIRLNIVNDNPVALIRRIKDKELKNKFNLFLQPSIEKLFFTQPNISNINGLRNIVINKEDDLFVSRIDENFVWNIVLEILKKTANKKTIISSNNIIEKNIKSKYKDSIIIIYTLNEKNKKIREFELILNQKNTNKYELTYKGFQGLIRS